MPPGEHHTIEGTGYLLRRNWIVPMVGALLAGLGLVIPVDVEGRALGAVVGWIAVIIVLVTLFRNAFRLSRKTSFRATSSALELSGLLPIPAEEILETKLIPRMGRQGEVAIELVLQSRGKLTLVV